LPELAFQHAADASGQLARVTALRCFIAWFHNELSQAERYAAQALRDLPPADLIYRAGIFGALADFELRQAHLPNAARYWRKALAAVHDRDNWGRLPLPLTGWVYIRLGELLYEWNEVAEEKWVCLNNARIVAVLCGKNRPPPDSPFGARQPRFTTLCYREIYAWDAPFRIRTRSARWYLAPQISNLRYMLEEVFRRPVSRQL
jgi:hypothetical protein